MVENFLMEKMWDVALSRENLFTKSRSKNINYSKVFVTTEKVFEPFVEFPDDLLIYNKTYLKPVERMHSLQPFLETHFLFSYSWTANIVLKHVHCLNFCLNKAKQNKIK